MVLTKTDNYCRGENHPSTIYTDEQVRLIRELSALGCTGPEIARVVGCHYNTVYAIRRGYIRRV